MTTVRGVSTPEPNARSAIRLLADSTVGPYVAAKLGSAIAVWIHNVVAAIVVFELSGSAVLVGAVSIAQFIPQVLLAPSMGALADRGNRRLQVAVGRLTMAAGSATLAVVLAYSGAGDTYAAFVVVGMALVVGLGFAVSVPATHAIVPSLVDRRKLPAVITLDTMPMTVARSVGPAIGGWLLAWIGAAGAFATAAAAQATYAVVVLRIKLRSTERARTRDRSVLAGVRYIRKDRVVGLLLLGVVAIGLGTDPVITLTPPLAAHFGGGVQLVAIMASTFGLGTAIAPLVLGVLRRWLTHRALSTLGLALLTAGTLGLAASPTPRVALAMLFVGGVGMFIGLTSLTTQTQQRLPEELRGRVMGLWAVCFMGSRPLAAAMNGTLADLLSVHAALLASSTVLAIILVLTRPSRIARAAVDQRRSR